MRIQVSDFNFKSRPGRDETGFIAQQLYTVLPEVVTQGGTNPATDPWMVDYARVTPLLTRAIQEQQGEIETLKQQNKNQEEAFKAEGAKETTLEKENAELKARVASLETSKFKINGDRSRNGCTEESNDHNAGESERQCQDRGAKAILDSLIGSIG